MRRLVLFRGAHQRELEVGDEGVVAFEQREVDVDALAHTGVGKMARHAVSIGRIRESTAELWQIVLRARVLNVGQQLAALPNQV